MNYRVILAYLDKLSADEPPSREEMLTRSTDDLYALADFLYKGWLVATDHDVKALILKLIVGIEPDEVSWFVRAKFLNPTEPAVKEVLLKCCARYPHIFRDYKDEFKLSDTDVNRVLSMAFRTPVEDFSHTYSSRLKQLQYLRSLAKKGGGRVVSIPQFKSFFSGREFLTVEDIDKLIEKDSKHNKANTYAFDHGSWGSWQNSFGYPQLVIQVKSLPSRIQAEINSKDYIRAFIDKAQKMSKAFHQPHPCLFGWARIHVVGDTWIIDEIQSDIPFIYKLMLKDKKGLSTLITQHLPEIGEFIKTNFGDIRNVIVSAVRERAHKAGIDKIEHSNIELKASGVGAEEMLKAREEPYPESERSHALHVWAPGKGLVRKTKGEVVLGEDKPIPEHLMDTYKRDLEKDGFERDEQTQRFKIHSSLDYEY